jgi:hypothetical protein
MKTFTKFTIVTGLALFIQLSLFAQTNKIALVHNGNSSFYTNFNTALSSAANGDTIYLPGGAIYYTTTPVINKQLIIIGVGHYPDSTNATQITSLNELFILTGADEGSLIGVRCNYLRFGNNSANQNVNNFKVERCRLLNVYPSCCGLSTSTNILFSNNVLGNFNASQFQSVTFEKNIFDEYSIYTYPAAFLNNVFHRGASPNYCDSYYSIPTNGALFVNNIFIIEGPYLKVCGTSTFENNLFCSPVSVNWNIQWGTSQNINSIFDRVDSTFIQEAINYDKFVYSNNYHLKTNSLSHNAGSDGTDLGIYGTQLPYKEAAIPFNPHISSKNISTQVSPTGMLNVDVKVSAQDR